MPIPIEAAHAELVINGVVYELRDVSVMQGSSIELDRMTYDGGRTIRQTRGRITSRVVIEAEVFPEPLTTLDPRLSTAELDQRFLERVGWTRNQAGLTGQRQVLQEAIRAALNDPSMAAVIQQGAESLRADIIEAAKKPQPPPAPEPRSVWDRLIGESLI
jgi:hypothetical protein